VNHVLSDKVITLDVDQFNVGEQWPPRKTEVDEKLVRKHLRLCIDAQSTPTLPRRPSTAP
jgi:hypothetical protein